MSSSKTPSESFEIETNITAASDDDFSPQEQSSNGPVAGGNNNNSGGGGTGPAVDQYTSPPRSLGVFPMAVLIFYSVSGGPFGCEASVRAAGSFYTLIGFLFMPLVWSVAEALVTAELASMYPEASGGVAWVQEAFGPQAGWMAGYMGYVSGATDNAIYPVLFLEYLLQILVSDSPSGGHDVDHPSTIIGTPVDIKPVVRFALLAFTSIILGYINWRGLTIVGNLSLVICAVSMSPFLLVVLLGSFQVEPSRWFERPDPIPDNLMPQGPFQALLTFGGVLWRPFLNNLFWNLNSFDSAASFAGDVQHPGYSIPRALFWSVLMVMAAYFIPLLVSLGATEGEQHDWIDGYFAVVAFEIGGKWLSNWIVFGAGIANIALFQSKLSAEAFQLMGMADRGLLPKFFSVRSKYGTPTYAIMLGTTIIVALSAANLEKLIEMLNFNYSVVLLMEYAAFFKLRKSSPNESRPFQIPLGIVGCVLLLGPGIVLTVVVMALASKVTLIFSLVANLIGLLVWYGRIKKRVEESEYDGIVPISEAEHHSAPPKQVNPIT